MMALRAVFSESQSDWHRAQFDGACPAESGCSIHHRLSRRARFSHKHVRSGRASGRQPDDAPVSPSPASSGASFRG
jgi:hypothetical protein